MSKDTAAPHVPSYRKEDRIFAALPPQHPSAARRREVQRFRRGDGNDGRRAWNPSTQDELHPFPQAALMHTTACYNGVDVVSSHFPATVKGSGYLRVPEGAQPGVWTHNKASAMATATRYRYRCPELETPDATQSYLARLIVEDAAPEKKTLRDGWCGSTILANPRRNHYLAAAPEDVSHQPAHTTLNHTLATTAVGGYVSPYNRVKQLNASRVEEQQQRRLAETESLESLYATRTGPEVFKLSNADQWWDMDPVAVTQALTLQTETMKANPYSTTFAKSKAGEQ